MKRDGSPQKKTGTTVMPGARNTKMLWTTQTARDGLQVVRVTTQIRIIFFRFGQEYLASSSGMKK
jgi:hypothetical protein